MRKWQLRVKEKITTNLNEFKSLWLDGLDPRKLKELTEVIIESFFIIY